jgi:hypothetical protein
MEKELRLELRNLVKRMYCDLFGAYGTDSYEGQYEDEIVRLAKILSREKQDEELKNLQSRFSSTLGFHNLLDGKPILCDICHFVIKEDVLTITQNSDPYSLNHTHFHPKCYKEK